MTLTKARLQGGPLDGQRAALEHPGPEPPERVWVEPCRACGAHWFGEATEGAEVYHRDVEPSVPRVYVWLDPNLNGETIEERELVGVGSHGGELEEA